MKESVLCVVSGVDASIRGGSGSVWLDLASLHEVASFFMHPLFVPNLQGMKRFSFSLPRLNLTDDINKC